MVISYLGFSNTGGHFVCYIMCKGNCVFEFSDSTVDIVAYPFLLLQINLKGAVICTSVKNVTLSIKYIQAAMIRSTRFIPKQTESFKDATVI